MRRSYKPLQSVDVRLARSDGGFDAARYQFEFFKVDLPEQHDAWMVVVTNLTAAAAHSAESAAASAAANGTGTAKMPTVEDLRPQLDDLHNQLRIQTEILRSVMQTGRMRFAASVQRSGAAMKAINAILKKPARDEAAFRLKLEEISSEAAQIRREAMTLQLAGLETAARQFEESLQELRNRATLSGNDFLPLAIQLDQLFGQFALLRSLTQSAAQNKLKSKPDLEATRPSPGRVTENGTQIIAPKFPIEPPEPPEHEASLPGMGNSAPAGTLESTLAALTEHIANEQKKAVALECRGLHKVPAVYQSAVKNVAIQFIRNAVMHGVEEPQEREEAGKPAIALLLLQFGALPDGTYELRFQDDGRGIDPVTARRVAVDKRLITSEAAERLRDRQAIKLIFQDGFTTLPSVPNQPLHGAGLSLVRRYVHDAGGKVALASDPGRETRFKVSLPALVKSAAGDEAQVA